MVVARVVRVVGGRERARVSRVGRLGGSGRNAASGVVLRRVPSIEAHEAEALVVKPLHHRRIHHLSERHRRPTTAPAATGPSSRERAWRLDDSTDSTAGGLCFAEFAQRVLPHVRGEASRAVSRHHTQGSHGLAVAIATPLFVLVLVAVVVIMVVVWHGGVAQGQRLWANPAAARGTARE